MDHGSLVRQSASPPVRQSASPPVRAGPARCRVSAFSCFPMSQRDFSNEAPGCEERATRGRDIPDLATSKRLWKGAAAWIIRAPDFRNAVGVGIPCSWDRGNSFLVTPGFVTESRWDKTESGFLSNGQSRLRPGIRLLEPHHARSPRASYGSHSRATDSTLTLVLVGFSDSVSRTSAAGS